MVAIRAFSRPERRIDPDTTDPAPALIALRMGRDLRSRILDVVMSVINAEHRTGTLSIVVGTEPSQLMLGRAYAMENHPYTLWLILSNKWKEKSVGLLRTQMILELCTQLQQTLR